MKVVKILTYFNTKLVIHKLLNNFVCLELNSYN